ncbi:MAG: hypothetical protein IJT06_04020 [Selenomonadaceae bacterium]|nr:hypothetical protein [Selenomonadaceae bacterium]
MKKFLSRIGKYAMSLLVVAAFLLTSATAFALGQNEQVMTNTPEELKSIQRLAVARPNHFKAETMSDEPTIEALTEILATTNKMDRFTIIPYAEIVEAIKRDKGIDLEKLDYFAHKKAFEENIGNYADAYVVLTTANNNDPTVFMFKVYNAQTNNNLYILDISDRTFRKNVKGYSLACETFYKTFKLATDNPEKIMKK